MSNLAFTDIGLLVTNNPELGDAGSQNDSLGIIRNASMIVEDGKVVWVGSSALMPAADEARSLGGKTVIPGFVDSHAHLLFAGDRADEFAARMAGQKYSAGGIRSTVSATRSASDEALSANLRRLEAEMLSGGITTFETKSGYGLDTENEVRSLRLAREATEEVTFLGAHVVPEEFVGRSDDYVNLVVGEMLDKAKTHAKWIDVFCDKGAFDGDQAFHVLNAGKEAGLLPRVHANQLEAGLGVEVAVAVDAASADHCTHLTDSDIELLAGSNTVATLLPGAEFSTRAQYPDARRLIAAGATVALATDCNPGSSYTTSMAFCIAVAVRDMHLTPDQAVWAATMGGAKALRRSDVGHLGIGASADFSVLDAPSHLHLAYRPGVDLIHEVWHAGKLARSSK
jgi:imidazolonepropionase